MTAQLREEPLPRGLTVEWIEAGRVFLARANELYVADSLHGMRRHVATVPVPAWKSAAARSRLAARALRFLFYNVLPLEDGELFVTFGRTVAFVRDGIVTLPDGLLRPTRVLRGACAWWRGAVYFGEYLDNAERHEVPVYRSSPSSRSVEVAYRLPRGTARHVHGVYADPFDPAALWITVGDAGAEPRIMVTRDGFRTVNVLGGGDESWRAVSLQFTADAIFYGTDAEFVQNVIYRVDRKSGQRDRIVDIEGPVYYSTAAAGRLFFGVTAELCASQQGRFAALWCIDESQGAKRIATFEKDRWSVPFFLPGTIDFARGPRTLDSVVFHMTATVGDGRTFAVQIP
jgi:hypothetical protein